MFQEKDFDSFLTVAKRLLADNEVTKNSNPGGSNTIRSIGLVRELGIRKIAVDQYFAENARGRQWE